MWPSFFGCCLGLVIWAVKVNAQTVLPPALTGLKSVPPAAEKKGDKPALRCVALEESGFDCAEAAPEEETARPLPKAAMAFPLASVASLAEDTALPRFAPPSDTQFSRPDDGGFHWRTAYRQSLAFLGIQHAFRLATEKGTRDELRGSFVKDYFKTLGKLAAWDDGDPFIVNYIGHPMMGAVAGYIQVQNDPSGKVEDIGFSNKHYWKSRLKAFGWSFAYSTQFEIGPISEASLGNIGIRPYEGHKHPMAYVDIVVTPVVGTAWLIGEDALDKYLIRHLDRRISNRVIRSLVRSLLNPSRGMANVLRGKYPWWRDDRSF
jgi:hypothetical protein